MKLSDLYESSKEAQLVHLARQMTKAGYKITPPPLTHGQFLAKVKDSTMSQREIDAVEDAMFGNSPSQKITRHDLEQISAIADVDLGELLSIAEIDLRESTENKKTVDLLEGMWVIKSMDGVEKRFKDKNSPAAKEWERSIKKKPAKAPKYSQEWWYSQDVDVYPWDKINAYDDNDEIQRIATAQFGKAMDDWSLGKAYYREVDGVETAHAEVRVSYTYGPEDDMGSEEQVSDSERIKIRRDVKKPETLVFAGF